MVYATNSAGYQAAPTEQPLAEELYTNAPLSYADVAKRNYARQRAADFGSRGEMSYDLDQINQLEDFNYSPQANGYLDALYGAMGANSEYNLTPMGGVGTAPLTSQQIEAMAARGSPESQLYANFNLSAPGSEWDAGNLQFDPGRDYRLIDRSSGNTLYSGTGYEAGKNISQMASDLYAKSGQKANWAIESAGADGNWEQRYDHDPDTSGFMNFLLMAAPFAALSALPMLGLAGASGTAGGIGAHAGIGATLGAGGLANAAPALGALGGSTLAGAGALAAPALGAGALGALGSVAAPITVVGGAAGGLGALAAPALAGGALVGGASAIGGGSASNAAATQAAPTPGQPPALPSDIVVSGAAPGGAGLGQSLAAGAALAGAAATAPGAGATSSTATGGQNPSTLSQISKYLELAGYGSGLLGNLFGGGGGTGANGTVPGGFGSLNPVFSGALPAANLPGVGSMTPRVMPQQDWNTYAMRPEQSFFNNVPQNVQGFADGGDVRGPGTGRSDSIPAALSDGEYVFDAETVAMLGDGSTEAGADVLDKFRVNIRKHKGKHLSRGKISPDAKAPEHYLAGGLA